jgi:serine/threonine-protein kinase
MFEREARLAGRLSHENIVDVKDAGRTDEGLAYIVMEWIEGRTLDEELLRQGRLSFSRAAGIARQVAAALGEAHRKHVIHRDLKPGNIMLIDSPGGRDHVKVLDFGIGKALGETLASSMVSTVVGTPHYASPEQLTIGGRIDGRSDIYSLGVILYRMVGGKPPFNSPSMGEVIQMQLTAEPAPLFTLRPETPLAVERLVNSMLAKNPARRPQSAAEVIAAIDQALPHLDKNEVAPTGDTTIQRGHNPLERTTEGMYVPPPAHGTFSTNIQRTTRVKPSAVYATIIGAALVAVGYGVYRYVSDGAAIDDPQDRLVRVTVTQTPATTGREVPKPSPSVAEVNSPSPKQTAVVEPTPPDRSRQNNLQSADKHFERAQELYRQLRYRDALRKVNEALTLNPKHREAQELKRQINNAIKILKPQ